MQSNEKRIIILKNLINRNLKNQRILKTKLVGIRLLGSVSTLILYVSGLNLCCKATASQNQTISEYKKTEEFQAEYNKQNENIKEQILNNELTYEEASKQMKYINSNAFVINEINAKSTYYSAKLKTAKTDQIVSLSLSSASLALLGSIYLGTTIYGHKQKEKYSQEKNDLVSRLISVKRNSANSVSSAKEASSNSVKDTSRSL